MMLQEMKNEDVGKVAIEQVKVFLRPMLQNIVRNTVWRKSQEVYI